MGERRGGCRGTGHRWVRPLASFGFGFHLLAGAAILAAGLRLAEAACDVFLKIFGISICLYVAQDIWSDTIARSGSVSDARMLAGLTGVPTVLWGGTWILLAVALTGFSLMRACRAGPRTGR